MRAASSALAPYLASSPAVITAPDCFTITLMTGSVLYFTNADVPVTYNGNVFVANSLRIDGLKYKNATGVDVDEQGISVLANPTDTIEGVPFLEACWLGVLDGALLQRDRVFLTGWGGTVIGGVTLFHGRISTIDKLGRLEAQIKVKSDLVVLDIDFPRNLYQPGCLHTLYDIGCTLSKASYGHGGTVASGSTISAIVWAGATLNVFDQGTVTFSSGPNAGVSRNIRHSDGSKLILSAPLNVAPGVGDAFTAYWGCDHSMGSGGCAKFSNLAHFRGFPFVPPPEVGL